MNQSTEKWFPRIFAAYIFLLPCIVGLAIYDVGNIDAVEFYGGMSITLAMFSFVTAFNVYVWRS